MQPRALFVLALLALGSSSGCSTQPSAYVRTVNFDQEGTFLTDARVRMINRVKPGPGGFIGVVDPTTVTCVEPSPDVAMAAATSFGAGISILDKGAGSLSGETVEGLAQLAERTTAIQALLRQGYQACLDYANGSISRTTYSLRTSRLDDLLVTMVLAEDASGAFGRSGAAIGTSARAEAQAKLASFPQARENAAKTREDLAKAEAKIVEDQNALDKAKADRAAAPAGTDTKALDKDVSVAESNLAASKAQRDLLLSQLSEVADTMSSAAGEVNKLIAMGGIDSTPDAQVAQVVGEMQERFLDKDVDQAFVSACLVEMALTTQSNPNTKTVAKLQQQTIDAAASKSKEEQEVAAKLADQLGRLTQTKLYEYCNQHLDPFLAESTRRRHELKMKQLDVAIAQINAVAGGTASRNETAPAVYPLAAFTTAKAALTTLTDKKNALTAQSPAATLPATEKAELIARKNDLLGRMTSLEALANQQLGGTNEDTIKTLENDRIALMGDPRRFGTTDQRATWQAQFDLKEAQARERYTLLRTLNSNMESLTNEAEALIGRLKGP